MSSTGHSALKIAILGVAKPARRNIAASDTSVIPALKSPEKRFHNAYR
jgi:hypothetical protein